MIVSPHIAYLDSNIKDISQETTATLILRGEKLEARSLKSGIRARTAAVSTSGPHGDPTQGSKTSKDWSRRNKSYDLEMKLFST